MFRRDLRCERSVRLTFCRLRPVDRKRLAAKLDGAVQVSTRIYAKFLVVNNLSFHGRHAQDGQPFRTLQRAAQSTMQDGEIADDIAHDRAPRQDYQFVRFDLPVDAAFHPQ